jgi:hypothetical protein
LERTEGNRLSHIAVAGRLKLEEMSNGSNDRNMVKNLSITETFYILKKVPAQMGLALITKCFFLDLRFHGVDYESSTFRHITLNIEQIFF